MSCTWHNIDSICCNVLKFGYANYVFFLMHHWLYFIAGTGNLGLGIWLPPTAGCRYPTLAIWASLWLFHETTPLKGDWCTQYSAMVPFVPTRHLEKGRLVGYAVKLVRYFTVLDGGKTEFLRREESRICEHLFLSGGSANSGGLIFSEGELPWAHLYLCSLAQALLWNFTVHSPSFPSVTTRTHTYRHMYSMHTHTHSCFTSIRDLSAIFARLFWAQLCYRIE